MADIVIIDDNIKRGMSVADGFKEHYSENPDCGIGDVKVLFYNNHGAEARKEAEALGCEVVDLFSYDDMVTSFMDEPNTIIISNLLLEDGNIGLIQRVNVRFALLHNHIGSGKLWFYDEWIDDTTAVLCAQHGILEHILDVKETMVENGRCRLWISRNEDFMNILKG